MHEAIGLLEKGYFWRLVRPQGVSAMGAVLLRRQDLPLGIPGPIVSMFH